MARASTWVTIIGGIGCAILALIPGFQPFAAACVAGVAALAALGDVMEAATPEEEEAALRRLGYAAGNMTRELANGQREVRARQQRADDALKTRQREIRAKVDEARAGSSRPRNGGDSNSSHRRS